MAGYDKAKYIPFDQRAKLFKWHNLVFGGLGQAPEQITNGSLVTSGVTAAKIGRQSACAEFEAAPGQVLEQTFNGIQTDCAPSICRAK